MSPNQEELALEAPDDIKTLAMLGADYRAILDYHRAQELPHVIYVCPVCLDKETGARQFCSPCADVGVLYL